VVLGLVAALSWGVYDFLSRFPSRAVGPIPTVLAVTISGLVVLSAWVLIGGDGITIVWPKLWLVAIADIFFALATLSLFAAFALGPMTVVAPVAGSYPALAMIRHSARRAPERVAVAYNRMRAGGSSDRVAERQPLCGLR
jgi:drug/metabolite transporter (DMT)-like permease